MGGRWRSTTPARRSRATPATCSRASPATPRARRRSSLSGHMDTVGPAEKFRPVVEGDIVRTDAPACWAATTRRGSWPILEAIRVLRERVDPPRRHRGGADHLRGIRPARRQALRHRPAPARRGLVLDVDGVCELITRAPAANRIAFTVHGLPAHAGICPEQGMSAIQVAAEAIAAMKLGQGRRGDHRESRPIQGGLATNIVPATLTMRGEARSLTRRSSRPRPRTCGALRRGGPPATRSWWTSRELPGPRRGPGRPAVRAARHPHDAPIVRLVAGRRRPPPVAPAHARHRGRLRRQRLRGARDRGRQPRLRHARDPHRQRVGRRARPGLHRRPGWSRPSASTPRPDPSVLQ